MAAIPFTGLSGQAPAGTIGLPDDYARIAVDPNAFGASVGAAEQSVGAKLEQGGGDVVSAATRMQAYQNRGVVTNALTSAQIAAQTVQTGDPNDPSSVGFYARKGADALHAYPDAVKAVQGAYSMARDSLQNPAQQELFDQESRRVQMATLATMGTHKATQQQVYAVEAQQGAVANSQKAAEGSYTSDGLFQANLQTALDAQQSLDALQGRPREEMQANAAKLTSDTWAKRILRMAADDPVSAQTMLKANMGAFDPATATSLLDHLRPGVVRAQGDAIGAAIFGGAAPSPTGGSASTSDITNAIYAQESGGGRDTSTSVTGARGGMQIQPATFAQYAKPGEDINNPADNKAVGGRIIADLSQRSGGDPARIAVGYFSGPGNIADPGSPTPWRVDRADPTGKTTSSYVRDILGRIGKGGGVPVDAAGGPSTGSGPGGPMPFPDVDAAMAKINQIDDPEVRARAASKFGQMVSHLKAGQTQALAAMSNTIRDTGAALEAGQDVDIPDPARVRQLYPPVQAQAILSDLADKQDFGTMRRQVDLASPDEIAGMRQDLASGTGLLPTMLRLRHGAAGSVDTGGDIAPASDGAPGAPPVAGEAMRLKLQTKFDQVVTARNKELQSDPAAFVASRDPTVQTLSAAVRNNPNDVASMEAYVDGVTAAQTRLGVPPRDQRVLPVQTAQSIVQKLTSADPAQTDVGTLLDQTAKGYGRAWPQVFGDLARAGLPTQYQVIAAMDTPGQTAARVDMQRALKSVGEKGSLDGLEKGVGVADKQAINQGIDDKLLDFKNSTLDASDGGDQLRNTIKQGVQTLAYYYAGRQQDGATALQNAVTGVLGRYDFDGTMRYPKGMGGDVTAATSAAVAALKPEDLADIGGGSAGMTPVDRQRVALDAAQRGHWSPNEDDTGLVLYGVRRNGGALPVRRADGSRIELKFNDMRYAGPTAALPDPAPALPAGP